MPSHDIPILEYDPTSEAMIEPSRVFQPLDIAPRCVLCFFGDVPERIAAEHDGRVLRTLKGETGPTPVYEVLWNGVRVALVHPRVGGPLAAAALEAVIALGCRRFVVCGGAGVLRDDLVGARTVLPVSAVRDEGTSYHYLPPSREVAADPEILSVLKATLQEKSMEYVLGKTWTTDAFYRETPLRVQRRRDEGCLTVEMEAASLFAVAQFRKAAIAAMFLPLDDLSKPAWDPRTLGERPPARESLCRLALDACSRL